MDGSSALSNTGEHNNDQGGSHDLGNGDRNNRDGHYDSNNGHSGGREFTLGTGNSNNRSLGLSHNVNKYNATFQHARQNSSSAVSLDGFDSEIDLDKKPENIVMAAQNTADESNASKSKVNSSSVYIDAASLHNKGSAFQPFSSNVKDGDSKSLLSDDGSELDTKTNVSNAFDLEGILRSASDVTNKKRERFITNDSSYSDNEDSISISSIESDTEALKRGTSIRSLHFSDKMHAIQIELNRDEKGNFGFGVQPMDDEHGVVVAEIYEDGPAARDGRLQIDDYLLYVNGQSVGGLPFTEVVNRVVKHDTVKLIVARERVDKLQHAKDSNKSSSQSQYAKDSNKSSSQSQYAKDIDKSISYSLLANERGNEDKFAYQVEEKITVNNVQAGQLLTNQKTESFEVLNKEQVDLDRLPGIFIADQNSVELNDVLLEDLPLLHIPSDNNMNYTGEQLKSMIKKLNSSFEAGLLKTQFKKLSNIKAADGCLVAQQKQNQLKNRYRNILPYDKTRVRLTSTVGDYINASHITYSLGGPVKLRYIATQHPLMSTQDDFWTMIWEQNVGAIAMLTHPSEGSATVFPCYLPRVPSIPLAVGSRLVIDCIYYMCW